jgi:site-specific recombinase XerD
LNYAKNSFKRPTARKQHLKPPTPWKAKTTALLTVLTSHFQAPSAQNHTKKATMSQNTIILIDPPRYSRTDYTALRAWVQHIPIAKVADMYYCADAPQVVVGLERFLTDMRNDLIKRAILANPQLAQALSLTINGRITPTILNILIEASDAKPDTPNANDHIGQWFRSKLAIQLTGEGIHTLQDLKTFIESNGLYWWTPIPRVGRLRANAVTTWLNRYEHLKINPASQLVVVEQNSLSPLIDKPIPLERIDHIPAALDGRHGVNRSPVFSYINARNDLEAVRAYIQKFRHQPHTARAYQRELERFLLWCVLACKKPMSSALVSECEEYKKFLEAPSPEFCGPRRGRYTPQWKPFAGPLSSESQKQAIQILRTAMGWMHKVRYLGGNPWAAVSDPQVNRQLSAMQIERALPFDLYERVVASLTLESRDEVNTQARIALAALLLMGDCGLRISEVASASAEKLVPSPFVTGQYRLTILGKGKKLRAVPLSDRTHQAIQAHQLDLFNQYGERPTQGAALIRPLTLPAVGKTTNLHNTSWAGYAPNSIARLIKKSLKSISSLNDVNVDDMLKLRATTAHGLRHTFGTLATEREMPLDVIQSILGHASIDTTSIYIRAQERRVAAEAKKMHSQLETPNATPKPEPNSIG